ncbi:MAG: baeRF3 domain-containing protein [Syntrophales bacterium]
MNVLTRDNLNLLMAVHKGPCVSVFMPMHRSGPETQQDPIRLKNLIREAQELLIARGLRTPEAKELLEPAERLLRDGPFRQHQSDGLAMFLSLGVFHYYRLPFVFEELVIVTDRFHIKPLLPLLSGDGRYFVLALSQNRIRLLQSTHYSVSELDVADVPENLAETLRDDDSWKDLQMHSALSGKGKLSAITHGDEVDSKENIRRYFRRIDRGLHELLRNERAPLVLAGVDYLHPIYKEVNSYPHLMDQGIAGNPERLSAGELHELTWTIVKPYFQKAQQEAVNRYKEFARSGQASNRIRKIIPAAYHGRIELLLVIPDLQQWGTFDPGTDEIHLHKKEKTGDEDLLEFAAIQTLMNGGTVYMVGAEKMPDTDSLAAVFRY